MKKLKLNKKVVVDLSNSEMNDLKGGGSGQSECLSCGVGCTNGCTEEALNCKIYSWLGWCPTPGGGSYFCATYDLCQP